MSGMTANDEETVEEVKPEQHILQPAMQLGLRKLHKDHKTLREIYAHFWNWEPGYEVWAYKYGPAALGLTSTISASYINYYFRETLYLLNYTRITSYVVMFAAPGLSAGVLHYYFVTRNILQENRSATGCPVCLQVRGMLLQGLASIAYPLILVPVICYPVAKRLQNYSVPNISFKNRYPVLQFTREMLKPIRGNIWAMTAAQVILGMGMTFYEQSNFSLIVKPKLDKIKTVFSLHFPHAKSVTEQKD